MDFTHCSGVYIADVEQKRTRWEDNEGQHNRKNKKGLQKGRPWDAKTSSSDFGGKTNISVMF